ncbi:MAG: hypothetical protein R2708_23985 [Vicinamibacterales bacterium]
MIARRSAAVIVMALASLAATVTARQTPEQRYLDWTSLPFPPAEYAARRAALAASLAASGGGVFLSPAAAGASEGFTFRQPRHLLGTSPVSSSPTRSWPSTATRAGRSSTRRRATRGSRTPHDGTTSPAGRCRRTRTSVPWPVCLTSGR